MWIKKQYFIFDRMKSTPILEIDGRFLYYAFIDGGNKILEKHLKTCVADEITDGNIDIIEDVMLLIKKLKCKVFH